MIVPRGCSEVHVLEEEIEVGQNTSFQHDMLELLVHSVGEWKQGGTVSRFDPILHRNIEKAVVLA